MNGSLLRGDERQSRTDDGFPIDVTLLTYNRGQDTVNEIPRTLAEGERSGSPGGQLVGIETPFGTFVNPNFDFDDRNCSGAAVTSDQPVFLADDSLDSHGGRIHTRPNSSSSAKSTSP